jgi:hypothetical protein
MATTPRTVSLAEAVRSAEQAAAEANEAERAVRGRAYDVLAQDGLTDRQIRSSMGWSRRQLRSARGADLNPGSEAVRAIWGAADIVTPWRRTSRLWLSGQVLAENNIAARHFSSTDHLDTSGAEYVNVSTGEKWLLVSHHSWNGLPPKSLSDCASGSGTYELYRISGNGTVTNPVSFLEAIDMPEDGGVFYANGTYRDGQAFDALHSALQRKLGVLPDCDLWVRTSRPRRRPRRWLRTAP